ncbi:MAG: GNAT family N-acetyltransferase [Deltaproteobacteria bacterium]
MSPDISVHQSISEIGEVAWDRLAAPEPGHADNPFLTYRFLAALEDSGSVGPGTGWSPRHLAYRENGEIKGVLPLYIKSHSQGEYVFDHSWAQAWERAGGRYYPKLQAAVPFTPVSGPRVLAERRDIAAGLLQAMANLAENNKLSSAHMTFCSELDVEIGSNLGFLRRTGQQFHWHNDEYSTFEDFLARLSSRKRKNIRKERDSAQTFGGEIVKLTGNDIRPEHWDAMWAFYQDTGSRKWGQPYLSRRFFGIAHETMRDDILLVMARKDNRWVAGAMNFIGRDCLYGRYWGQADHHDSMHFELCYYQAIDYAIAHGLARVEAGAQGEHKLARGYLPVITHSIHYIPDEGFRRAVAEFVVAEQAAVEKDVEILTSYGPFKRGGDDQE